MDKPSVQVITLGKTTLLVDGEAITGQRKKTILLFIYMCMAPGDCSRERLANLYWPESTRSASLACLRRCLFDLNKCGLSPFLESGRNIVTVNLDNVWIDALEFQKHLENCTKHGHSTTEVCDRCIPELSRAIELYHGEFLRDMLISDSLEFDNWHQWQSEELRTLYGIALERYAIYAATKKDFSKAISLVQQLLSLDPLRESSRQLMMLLYAGMDHMQSAIDHYVAYKDLLDEELAISPGNTIRNLYYTLVQREDYQAFVDYESRVVQSGVPLAEPNDSPEEKMAYTPNRPHSPATASSIPEILDDIPLLGREREIAQVTDQLRQPDCHLLTILGVGGVGKKRLAIEVANQLKSDFSNGIHFVDLSKNDDLLPLRHQIANALGFSFYSGQQQEKQLVNYLHEKSLLLVLTNFESYMDELDWLKELLLTARQIKVLVTSRIRLNLPQERILILEGLTYKATEQHAGRELFLHIARKNNIGMEIRPEENIYVDEIIELVAGVPLAIHLAASWTSIMGCRDISDAIKEDMGFLNSPNPTMGNHHHSLNDIFDQTWNLLTEAEQAHFAALSMFKDTFLLESAQAIAQISIPQIVNLVNKSLVTRAENRRFQVNVLLRQFANKKLKANPDLLTDVQSRFVLYYADFAKTVGDQLTGPHVGKAIRQLTSEIANIINAWELSLHFRQHDLLNKMLDSVYFYYRLHDLNDVGNVLMAEAISQVTTELYVHGDQQEAMETFLAKAYLNQSWFLANLGDRQQAHELAEKSYELALNLELEDRVAAALIQLGYLALIAGDHARARELIEQSLEIARSGDDIEGIGKASNTLSIVLRRQDCLQDAKTYARISLEQYQKLQDPLLQSYAFNTLGLIALQDGSYEEARQLFQRSHTLKEDILPDSRWMEACSFMNLGLVARHQGDLGMSRDYLNKSVQLFKDIGHPDMSILSSEELGEVLIESGYLNQAGQFLSEGLHKAWDIQNDKLALRIMIRIAKLMRHRNEHEKAHELVESILSHPACTDEIRALASEILA